MAPGHYPAIALAAARPAALEGKDEADLVGAMLDEFFLRYAESIHGRSLRQGRDREIGEA